MPLHLLVYRSLPVLVIILFNFCLFMELNFRDSTFVDLNYYFLLFHRLSLLLVLIITPGFSFFDSFNLCVALFFDFIVAHCP